MTLDLGPYYSTRCTAHDRMSCSDTDPVNADATGSTGCARCTAILLKRGEKTLDHLERVLNGCRTAYEQQAADTAAREFLEECGR